LPVRIDLIDYNADQLPLFIGTSVVPYVFINRPATGPNAGKLLQADVPQSARPGPSASALGAGQ
jgi:membrane fusion protein (multidrug efflux system)